MKKKIPTPITLTAVERAKMLGIQPKTTDMTDSEATLHERMNAIRASFGLDTSSQGKPADTSADMDMSFALLPVEEIEPYRYNPRTSRNPRYDEIKASIQADGITNMLTVTRRDKNSKYTTYGGGNTRLMIAKELAAAGDQRFAKLQVIFKEWPGDAQIITAQLAENENRGDISFWEKACAVEQFRIEFEKESGRVLSSNGLHTELRNRGLNYSARTVQNFTFSIEHFRPIGQWLRAKEVNETLRPAYSALQTLGKTFDKDADVQTALEDVLAEHGKRLEEEAAKQAVELDVQALIASWHAAVGKVLDTSAEHVQVMLAAQKEDAGISADALRNVSATPPLIDDVGDGGEARSDNMRVVSLPRRTVPTPSFKPTTRDADDDMMSINDEGAPAPRTRREAQPNLQGLITPIPAMPQEEQPPMDYEAQNLLAGIKDTLRIINTVVPLHDVLCESDVLPFGFFIDLPATADWSKAGDIEIEQPLLRAALWRFIAAISGQLDKRVTLPSAADGFAFSSDLVKDEGAFRAACENAGLPVGEDGLPVMSVSDTSQIFADPYLTVHVIKLTDTIEKLRAIEPGRAPNGFVGLFAAEPETGKGEEK